MLGRLQITYTVCIYTHRAVCVYLPDVTVAAGAHQLSTHDELARVDDDAASHVKSIDAFITPALQYSVDLFNHIHRSMAA